MMMTDTRRLLRAALWLPIAAIAAAGAERAPSTVFAFDDHTISHKDNLYVTMHRAEKHGGNPDRKSVV